MLLLLKKNYDKINKIFIKLISLKGNSSLGGRSKRAAVGVSAVLKAMVNGPLRRCGEICVIVAASGMLPVKKGAGYRESFAVSL
jgi:hypothetical protein